MDNSPKCHVSQKYGAKEELNELEPTTDLFLLITSASDQKECLELRLQGATKLIV